MLTLQCEPAKRSGPARMHRRSNAGRVRPRAARTYLSARLPLLDGFRPGGGVVLSWWMEEGIGSAEEATLDVIDATGRVVRTFEPAREGEERDRWNQDPLDFPIKVTNRLANLLSMSERGDGRPGEAMVKVLGVMMERFGGVREKLEGVMREVEAFLEREFEAANEGLRATGGDEIVPSGVGVGGIVLNGGRF